MGATSVIYIDVFFLINFLMDYLILWTTARFGQIKASRKRITAGALLGGLYPLLWFYPAPSFLFTTLVVFIYSVLLVAVAFAPLNLKKYLRALAYFYLVSFALGGVTLGTVYMTQGGARGELGLPGALDSFSVQILLAAVAGAVILARWGGKFLQKDLRKASYRTSVILRWEGRQIEVEALIDTGNQLVDPLSRRPVMVVEYQVLAPYLPDELKRLFQNQEEPDWAQALTGLPAGPWVSRLRLIPFSSIGKRHGLLLGIRTDEVILKADKEPVSLSHVVVGLYHHPLCPEGSYQALLHPQMLGGG